jgi:thiamine kinase-like enzyme
VGDNLYVFDWEYASMSFPANYDLAHMLHSLNNLSDNVDVSLLLENILNDIGKTQEPFSFGKTTFLAYLISNFLFYSSRNIKSGTDYSIDEQNVSLVKMIDFFIG